MNFSRKLLSFHSKSAILTFAVMTLPTASNSPNDKDWTSKVSSVVPLDKLPNSFDISEISKLAHNQFNSTLPGQLGYGFSMGYCSGYCLKKTSKMVAFGVGGIFITIQTLSYNGYIQVNMDKLEKDVDSIMDLNHDGKVDIKDAEVLYNKAYPVLAYHMPTGGSFLTGFTMGIRS